MISEKQKNLKQDAGKLPDTRRAWCLCYSSCLLHGEHESEHVSGHVVMQSCDAIGWWSWWKWGSQDSLKKNQKRERPSLCVYRLMVLHACSGGGHTPSPGSPWNPPSAPSHTQASPHSNNRHRHSRERILLCGKILLCFLILVLIKKLHRIIVF